MIKFNYICALGALLVLAGCKKTTSAQALDVEASRAVKKVSVEKIKEAPSARQQEALNESADDVMDMLLDEEMANE